MNSTVIVAIVGILGTLLAPLLNHFLTMWVESKKWLRDQRVEVYLEYLDVNRDAVALALTLWKLGQLTSSGIQSSNVQFSDLLAKRRRLLRKVRLFGSLDIVSKCEAIDAMVLRKIEEGFGADENGLAFIAHLRRLEQGVVDAVREQLGISRF